MSGNNFIIDKNGNLSGPHGVMVHGTSGGNVRSFSEEVSAALSGATTQIEVNIPAGTRISGAQFRVDTLITSGDGGTDWGAALSGGATSVLATTQPFTKNTKSSGLLATQPVAASETDITITCNGGTFSGGVIRAIVYYAELIGMDDAP